MFSKTIFGSRYIELEVVLSISVPIFVRLKTCPLLLSAAIGFWMYHSSCTYYNGVKRKCTSYSWILLLKFTWRMCLNIIYIFTLKCFNVLRKKNLSFFCIIVMSNYTILNCVRIDTLLGDFANCISKFTDYKWLLINLLKYVWM